MSDTKTIELDMLFKFLDGYDFGNEWEDIARPMCRNAAAELAQLRTRLETTCRVKAKDKVGFDWEILDTIDQLRSELDEAIGKAFWVGHTYGRVWGKKAISREEIANCGKEIEMLRLEAHPEETK